jgi:hypothetical protein
MPDLYNANDLQEWITLYDKHSYLVPYTPTTTNDEDKTTTTPQTDTSNHISMYYFRHKTIMNCIYESQPYSERVQMHVKFAAYFECQLSKRSKEELLPFISHHYGHGGNLFKNVQYLEEFAYVISKMASILVLKPSIFS